MHVAPPPALLDDDTIATLRVAILILARRMRYQQAAEEISPSEGAVLGRVAKLGGITPGQLARSEHVQPPSMTRTLERLEGKGLLRRDPDPEDRRQVRVFITDDGQTYLERNRQLRTAWLTEQLGKLDAADQQMISGAAASLGALAELA